ncbi:hypothetical protein ISF_00995 [Cordyceps fumosorosea ARSEF 2679]|uniref:Uncharacterized protein n=1 Tax=Cordyceps fumosorosea (strain ARSEF 2679) TaxID=1081104 RepID=A0A162LQC9_CORFA|nr:hypothetical protein ISF_00995 [Cordyceps fumosorosea ARSEF 2679]OAA74094.1 hypothetical protein ISF_00995 [Cordyceps fumosorosea ARSEF 2679]
MPSAFSTALLVLSKVPLVLKTVLFWLLSLSPTARKWDLRTELAVTTLRDFFGGSSPTSSVSAQQALFMRDGGARGRIWVSRVTLPAPDDTSPDGVLPALCGAVAALGDEAPYTRPPLQDVGGEWVGVRRDVSRWAAEPADLSEREKYARLTNEARGGATVLYVHGGANYLPIPPTPTAGCLARPRARRLARRRRRLRRRQPLRRPGPAPPPPAPLLLLLAHGPLPRQARARAAARRRRAQLALPRPHPHDEDVLAGMEAGRKRIQDRFAHLLK